MAITGPPRATFLYPRFTYGTTPITIDLPEPATIMPQPAATTGLASENRVASGKSEVLFGRNEEACGLILQCEPPALQQLRWMVEEWAFPGNQIKVWVDRYTGSCWMFENALKDENGLALTLSTGTATYADATSGRGIQLSGSQSLSVATAQASAATPTGYDDPFVYTEGVLVIDWKPAFAAGDAVGHYILDTAPDINRITVRKNATNNLAFDIVDAAGGFRTVAITGAGSWVSGDHIVIVASWDTSGSLTMALSRNGVGWTAGTVSGAGTGLLSAMPTTLFIGSNNIGGNVSPGIYDTIAFYKKAFLSPHLALAAYQPWRRNYFPYGEVTARQFGPVRFVMGRQIYNWPVIVRNGQPD